MDEACYVLNSDAYGRLKYKKMMQQFMEEVEKMLPMLQEHPIINEIALRMSFYAYRMDDYERCKKYYEEYRRIRLLVSIEQYTPWMHAYLMVVSFVVRVLYILDTIRKLPSTNEFIREKASVRQKICDIIESHLPKTCPTIEELILAYGDVMVPVGAEN